MNEKELIKKTIAFLNSKNYEVIQTGCNLYICDKISKFRLITVDIYRLEKAFRELLKK